MIDTSAARQAILSRIRSSHPQGSPASSAANYAGIERSYNRVGKLDDDRKLDLLEERLLEYDARVHRVSHATLPAVIAASIRERGAARMAIPFGLPQTWLPATIPFTEAGHLSALELNDFDGFLSGCTVAIALTGTIVLQNAAAQAPRRLSLIPDYHLCVVLAEQVVETVPEALDRLAATATLPTTFISGPSATADIEMTRVKGVHGPRFLDVLIVS